MKSPSDKSLVLYGKQAVIKTTGRMCSTPRELLSSDIFEVIVREFLLELHTHDTVIYRTLSGGASFEKFVERIIGLLWALASASLDDLTGCSFRA